MVHQNIWVAIAVGLFVAGIGIGYAVFSGSQVMSSQMMDGSMNSLINDPQAMQQMMEDPNFRNEMLDFMIQDTEHMNQWMQDDPQHIPLMIDEMKANHDFMMGMALPMVQDSGLRLQLLGHMTESPEAMAQIQQMMGDGMTGGMMGSEMIQEMIGDPETRIKMINLMDEHVTEMQELLSSELSDEEFDTKMIELMEIHQQSMMELMDDGSTDHDEEIGHDETIMDMSTSPQTYIVSIAEGSGVPGCELTDECYLPYSLEVGVGDTVSWNNIDSAAHTVTSGTPNNPDGNFDSGMMMVNQSWEFTFIDSGEYDYYCILHPWMIGKITVNQVEETIVIPESSGEPTGHDENH